MSRYVQKGRFGPKCPNMVIRAQVPEISTFFKLFDFVIFSTSIRFQRALNQYSMTIIDQDMTKYH